MHANQLYKCRGKKKKIIFIVFYNIIPTLTLPLTLRSLYSFSDVEHIRSGQWSYLPLPAPAVFSGRKAQYLRREFFFSPLRTEIFYQVKSCLNGSIFFHHQNILPPEYFRFYHQNNFFRNMSRQEQKPDFWHAKRFLTF